MNMRRQLLLLALGLATATGAMAQTAVTSKLGDEDNKDKYPASLGTVENASYKYSQINVAGDELNTAYITKGATVPFYVAPSYVMNAGAYDGGLKLITELGTLANKGTFVWKIYAQDGTTENPANYVLTPTENKATVQVQQDAGTGEHVRIYVNQVLPTAYQAFKGCNDQYTSFEVVAVDKPELHMTAPKLSSTAVTPNLTNEPFSEVAAYGVEVRSATEVVVPADAKVMMYKTCNTALLANTTSVNLDLAVSEGGAPDNLAHYGFSIKGYTAVIGNVFATPTQENTAQAWASATKEHDATAGGDMVAKAAVPAEGQFTGLDFGTTTYVPGKYYDFIFKLEKAEHVTTDGLVSAISMRSHATDTFLASTDAAKKDYDGTTFGFASTAGYRYAVIRLLIPPKTGPVYHIPVSLFK